MAQFSRSTSIRPIASPFASLAYGFGVQTAASNFKLEAELEGGVAGEREPGPPSLLSGFNMALAGWALLALAIQIFSGSRPF